MNSLVDGPVAIPDINCASLGICRPGDTKPGENARLAPVEHGSQDLAIGQ
jgi:hypothetical protein